MIMVRKGLEGREKIWHFGLRSVDHCDVAIASYLKLSNLLRREGDSSSSGSRESKNMALVSSQHG